MALGFALIAVPMIALPKPDDYWAEYKSLATMEEKELELVDASRKQWQANQITGDQYANILENQILPQWRTERENMEK